MQNKVKGCTKRSTVFLTIFYVVFLIGGIVSFVLVTRKINIPVDVTDKSRTTVSEEAQTDSVSLLDYILFGNTEE